jgi:hypothetical protein
VPFLRSIISATTASEWVNQITEELQELAIPQIYYTVNLAKASGSKN